MRFESLKIRFIVCLMLVSFVAVAQPVMPGSKNPSGRIDYAIGYIPFLRAIVMHGGWAPPDWQPTNEMWTWSENRWSKLSGTHAPAFAHHAMAFDSGRNVLVLCGRPSGGQPGEYQMWEFNGQVWSRKASVPVHSNAQGDPKLTYDDRRQRLVLYAARHGGTSEIWEFNGKDWQLIPSQHHPVRCDENGCLFQYDGDLGGSVLVGEDRTSQEPLAWNGREWGMAGSTGTETWLWNGNDWARIPGQQPPRAVWGGMAYDPTHHEMVLITTRMETWAMRSGKWTELQPDRSPSPSPNGFFAMAYDGSKNSLVFFGGESRPTKAEGEWKYSEATWVFDGNSWMSY